MNFATDLSQSILADITQQCGNLMPVDLLQNISTMVSDDALIRSSIQSGNQEVCFFDNEMAAFKRSDYEGQITDLPDGVWTVVGKRTTFANGNLPFSFKSKNEGNGEQLVMTSITFSSGNLQYTRRVIEKNSTINFDTLNILSSGSGLSLIQKTNSNPPLLVRTKTLEVIGEIQLHQVNVENLIFSQPCFDHTNDNCYFSAIDKTKLQLQLIEWNLSSGATSRWDIKIKPTTSIQDDSPTPVRASQLTQVQPNCTQKVFLTENWVVIALLPTNASQATFLYHIPKTAIAASASDSYGQERYVEANVIEIGLKRLAVDVAVDYEDKGSNINYAFTLYDALNQFAKPIIKRYCFDPPNPRELQIASESEAEAPLGTVACIVNAPVAVNNSVFFSPGIWSPEIYKTYPQNSCLFNTESNKYTFPAQTWISGVTQVPSNSNKNFLLLCCTYASKDKSSDNKKIVTELQIFDCSELNKGPAFVIKAAAPFDFGQLCTKGSWDSAI